MSDDTTDGPRRHGRRGVLEGLGTASLASGLATLLGRRSLAGSVAPSASTDETTFAVDPAADPNETFPQSVASGGPTPAGVILWTRIAPDAVVDGEPLGVQVATDETFDELVFEGTVPATRLDGGRDHTVKVDLDPQLEPDHRYYYRFAYDGVTSRTGRCRTLPAPDASPDECSVAVLTCQDYQNGYYGAYHHLAEEDVDFVVHLGDFIYESTDGSYTSPTDGTETRQLSLPSGADLAESLADFRHLHRVYKSDPLLQEGLEAHTFVHGWDDHEIGNNRFWDDETDSPVLPDKDGGDDPEFAVEITANGIQAWVEYMPARVEYDPDAENLQEQLQLWRTLQFGDLVDLAVTDERLFRDGPPCTEWQRVTCTNEEDWDRTMLGTEQKQQWKAWVADSDARWTVWANQVLSAPLTVGDGSTQVELLLDSWDGFQYERFELMQHVQDADPRNFVILTGDLHAALASQVKAGYGEIEWWRSNYEPIGVELMTPAVTSVNAADVIDFPGDWDESVLDGLVRSQNEHLAFVDWYSHGYAVVEFGRDEASYTVYEVDKSVDATEATKTTVATYRIPDGKPRVEPAGEH